MKRLVVSLLLMGGLSACALTVDEVDLAYKTQDGVVAVGGANAVEVQVKSSDARTSNRDRISVKKNGYGMEMAAIVSRQDVPGLVGKAIEDELKMRGFRVGQGKVFVLAEVNKFYNDFKMGFFTGEALGEVMVNVQVLNADGRSFYAKSYVGEYREPDVMLFTGDNAKKAVEGALQSAVAKMVGDQYLIQAVIEANRALKISGSGVPTS